MREGRDRYCPIELSQLVVHIPAAEGARHSGSLVPCGFGDWNDSSEV